MSSVHWIPQSLTKPAITIGTGQQVVCSLIVGAICWAAFITLFPIRIIYLDGISPILFCLHICARNLWNLDVYDVIMDTRGRCICNGPDFERLVLGCESWVKWLLLASAKLFINCKAQGAQRQSWLLFMSPLTSPVGWSSLPRKWSSWVAHNRLTVPSGAARLHFTTNTRLTPVRPVYGSCVSSQVQSS